MATGLFTLRQQNQGLAQSAWSGPQKPPAVEVLLVGGGGSSGAYPGGGAGGLIQNLYPVNAGSAITVTIGAGAAANSSANGTSSVFGDLVALGGGTPTGNATPPNQTNAGGYTAGSGGGGRNGVGENSMQQGGQGTFGQGNAGGFGRDNAANYLIGGGGGAGSQGQGATNGAAGSGGQGVASLISNTITGYAGGGGGGQAYANYPGKGGQGGGGNAGDAVAPTPASGYPGTANTGGGGGGVSYNGYGTGLIAGAGGSGVCVVSYPDVYAAATATTGSPTVTTSGSGSLAFTGATTNYLYYGGQTPFVFGTGDFTIEFWVYFNSLGGIIVDWRAGGSNGAYPTFYISGSSMIYYVNGVDVITSSALSTSTWYHIAVCRIGVNTKMYLNGTQTGSTYTDTTNYIANSTAPWIGSAGTTLNGYLTNLRAVKGVGVYTGTFTSPTSPLAATQSAGTNIAAITGTQTSLLLNSNSGARLADNSTNSYRPLVTGSTPAWNAASPFTATGYKNRVYRWTGNGSITF